MSRSDDVQLNIDVGEYRVQIATLVDQLTDSTQPVAQLESTVLEVLRAPISAAVLAAAGTDPQFLAARTAQVIADYTPRDSATARSATHEAHILLLQQIDLAWWRDAADFATDADLADSPALVDLRTLRRRGQLAFKFSLASDRLWPRAYKYLIRRIAPNTAPGTPGLSSPYVRPHMVALLNTIATQFREASASQAPPLWINCITRTVTDQCRLQELGFSAHYPSAHCRGWAADVEVGWYERSGYRDTLVTILDRMRQAQHINAIDEGRIWHISPHPDFVAVH
jgi:hypothetical protein